MAALLLLVQTQPGWGWLAIGATLLAIELVTGSGYLLWPSAAAGVVGLLTLVGAPINAALQVVLFAALTIVSTYAARRWLPRRAAAPDIINDARARLVGHEGEGVAASDGRVFVDGKEWSAVLADGSAPLAGQKVRVVEVLGGARLKVAPI